MTDNHEPRCECGEFSRGRTQGYQEGKAIGSSDGYRDGHHDGQANGLIIGHAQGVKDGYVLGHHRGFADGSTEDLDLWGEVFQAGVAWERRRAATND